ncbi:YdiU family protein [Pontibacter sp. SGAir0037]|uniref:protein adenylyltransferase SelO n=1 Tax=Pontibacter sp. SGAir0037 TaxID=2571030 RepID=UPI0010CCE948|nr:YdiU family protein [Pontibacter sp. SGAir0037]QCR22614.1 YdiU family protein [Pontibacter sp. SGAir0037]
MQSLSSKKYKKVFTDTFPGDESGDKQPRQTPGVLYSKAIPTPVKQPELLAWSEELAKELGILKPASQEEVELLSGNRIAETMYPYAACYAGHQFGHWAGQLGDGRAITLGEWETTAGKAWELQLKGAGPTPYSRRADGRAVMRSSVREYLMSEAMHYLGVPTTRALSLVSTGDQVMRDMFYNGNAAFEPGAIVMRVAPSFLRFGNFEILAARKEKENLQKLTDWTISRYYPHIAGEGEEKVLAWFKEIVERTAALMVEWLRVGFVHGVMNTDNMSILGLTIDYGPYSFLDDYDPNFTPNTTDLPGRRYAFGKQAAIAKWNLGCLASAIAPLLSGTEQLIAALEAYDNIYWEKYYTMMANKIGLDLLREQDVELIRAFEKMLSTIKPDMTIFFQLLINLPAQLAGEEETVHHFQQSFYNTLDKAESELLFNLMQQYMERLTQNSISEEDARKRMQEHNPRFILRNYLLHQAIEELERGNNDLFLQLQDALKEPYSAKYDKFFAKRPAWASQKAGCSMLSCSS